MPNHFHGIVHIVGNRTENVGNRHACSLQEKRHVEKLPVVVGTFKSVVAKKIHRAGKKYFEWQKSYHDRIIRNDDELNRIRSYILDNPVNWQDDDYFANG